jgi:hypothetical protein
MVFKPGGGGRPAGVRNRFSHAFMSDFLADWEKYGASAIKSVRMTDPATYLRVGATILPKEMVLETMTTGLTVEERTEMIAVLKQHLLSRQQEQPMMIEAKVNEPESKS